MKKTLTKNKYNLYHMKDGVRIEGVHSELCGYVTGLRGDVSGLYGNVSGLYGNVSGLRGDVTRLSGDASEIYGNLDDCEITDEDRAKGISVSELIEE